MGQRGGRGTAAVDWAALAADLDGELLLPGSATYEAVRRPALARFADVRPAAVARCAGPSDVAAALAFAVDAGLPVAVRAGGHSFAGRSSTRGLLVDVSPMRGVRVDGDRAHVAAGTRLPELYEALHAAGRTVPAGCGPTVGVAGHVLTGGHGVLGRAYGLASDRLVAAEVVLADGRTVTCSGEEHADLLWGLRGGGAIGLGVLTALVLSTVPAPTLTALELRWPAADAVRVLDAWQRWAPDAPDEVAASLHLVAAGTAEPLVLLRGAAVGGESSAAALLDGFVAAVGHEPTAVDLHAGSVVEAKRHLVALDPPDDAAVLDTRSAYVARVLPLDVVDRLVATLLADRSAGVVRALDLVPWGGAYGRVDPGATAFPHRRERALVAHTAVTAPGAPAAVVAAGRRWLTASTAAVAAFAGGSYAGFAGPDLTDAGGSCYGANLERLERVRATYDPDGVLA